MKPSEMLMGFGKQEVNDTVVYTLDEWRQIAKATDELETKNEALKETLRIDWEVIVDAIDDQDIKQAVVRLWVRAGDLLAEKETP